MLNRHICAHCTNAYRETCVTECAPTRNYCAFTPRRLREGERLPRFPIAEFLEMTAREARVLTGLHAYWHSQQQAAHGRPPFHDNGQPIYLRERLVDPATGEPAPHRPLTPTNKPSNHPKADPATRDGLFVYCDPFRDISW